MLALEIQVTYTYTSIWEDVHSLAKFKMETGNYRCQVQMPIAPLAGSRTSKAAAVVGRIRPETAIALHGPAIVKL